MSGGRIHLDGSKIQNQNGNDSSVSKFPLFSLISIRFGSCEVRRPTLALNFKNVLSLLTKRYLSLIKKEMQIIGVLRASHRT